jgi:hypothetical protein
MTSVEIGAASSFTLDRTAGSHTLTAACSVDVRPKESRTRLGSEDTHRR